MQKDKLLQKNVYLICWINRALCIRMPPPLLKNKLIMARITVEDCLDKVTTRYELIILAAKRARQLATGGRRPTLEWENDKPTVMALREIEAGTVSTENINDLKVDIADLEQEFSEGLSAEDLPQT